MSIDYKTLENARKYLEENVLGFPNNKCQTTSRFLGEVFGFEEVAGYFLPKTHNIWHALNYVPEKGLYVDLSMDQFNIEAKKYEPIMFFEKNASFFEERESFTNTQQKTLTPQLNPELNYLIKDFKEKNF